MDPKPPDKSRRATLVFDLETVPDPELYEAPTHLDEKERPIAPVYAQVPIVIGMLWLDRKLRFKGLEVLGGDQKAPNERALLQAFVGVIEQHEPRLVTYNGRTFDMPVIVLRCLRHGLSLPWYYGEGEYRDRRSQEGHLDLCDVLSEHGACRRMSLDVAARLAGLPGKGEIDGSQVESLHRAGKLEEIQRYCLSDVVQTGLLLLRFRLLQGELTPKEYQRTAADLCRALKEEPRVKQTLARCDLDRLLLGVD